MRSAEAFAGANTRRVAAEEPPNEAFAFLLERRGISGEELATLSGVDPSTISKLRLRAQYPRWETACAVARVLRVGPEELWDPARCRNAPAYAGLLEAQRSRTQLAWPLLRLRYIAARRKSSLNAVCRAGGIDPRWLRALMQSGGRRCECAMVDRLVAAAAELFGREDHSPSALGWEREGECYVEAW